MANYTSLELTPPVYPVSGVGLGGRTSHHARGQFTPAANLAAGDVIGMFDIPTRSRIKSGFLKGGSADSGTGITLNVGIVGTPALFFSASTAAQGTGSVDRNLQFAGTDYVTTQKTRVIITVAAAPTTPVTGNPIVLMLEYLNEEPA